MRSDRLLTGCMTVTFFIADETALRPLLLVNRLEPAIWNHFRWPYVSTPQKLHSAIGLLPTCKEGPVDLQILGSTRSSTTKHYHEYDRHRHNSFVLARHVRRLNPPHSLHVSCWFRVCKSCRSKWFTSHHITVWDNERLNASNNCAGNALCTPWSRERKQQRWLQCSVQTMIPGTQATTVTAMLCAHQDPGSHCNRNRKPMAVSLLLSRSFRSCADVTGNKIIPGIFQKRCETTGNQYSNYVVKNILPPAVVNWCLVGLLRLRLWFLIFSCDCPATRTYSVSK